MRARLALLAAGIRCEIREIALSKKPASLLAVSPKGTVPVLVLPDAVIEQSLDIMLWALHQNDPYGWLPKDKQLMDVQLALIKQCDDEFKYHLDRYKYPDRYQLADGLFHRQAGAEFLHTLTPRLEISAYLSAGQWGFADAAIAPFVRQFAHTDPNWFSSQSWTPLIEWLTHFEASEHYHKAMHKYKVWHPDSKPVAYPAI